MYGEPGHYDGASIPADLGPLVAGTKDGDVTAVLSPAMDRLAGYAIAGILSDNVDRDGFPVLLVTDRTREFVRGAAREPLYVEDVILALDGRCDGAVRRDRVGFGTDDAFDGNRIGAMLGKGIPLGPEEAEKALGLAADHAVQYARANIPNTSGRRSSTG